MDPRKISSKASSKSLGVNSSSEKTKKKSKSSDEKSGKKPTVFKRLAKNLNKLTGKSKGKKLTSPEPEFAAEKRETYSSESSNHSASDSATQRYASDAGNFYANDPGTTTTTTNTTTTISTSAPNTAGAQPQLLLLQTAQGLVLPHATTADGITVAVAPMLTPNGMMPLPVTLVQAPDGSLQVHVQTDQGLVPVAYVRTAQGIEARQIYFSPSPQGTVPCLQAPDGNLYAFVNVQSADGLVVAQPVNAVMPQQPFPMAQQTYFQSATGTAGSSTLAAFPANALFPGNYHTTQGNFSGVSFPAMQESTTTTTHYSTEPHFRSTLSVSVSQQTTLALSLEQSVDTIIATFTALPSSKEKSDAVLLVWGAGAKGRPYDHDNGAFGDLFGSVKDTYVNNVPVSKQDQAVQDFNDLLRAKLERVLDKSIQAEYRQILSSKNFFENKASVSMMSLPTSSMDAQGQLNVYLDLLKSDLHMKSLGDKYQALAFAWGGRVPDSSFTQKLGRCKDNYLALFSPADQTQARVEFNNAIQAALEDTIPKNVSRQCRKIRESNLGYQEKKQKIQDLMEEKSNAYSGSDS